MNESTTNPGENDAPLPDESREEQSEQAPSPQDELAAAREQAAQLRDQLLRKIAEFENFRRRTREEQQALVSFANESLIIELLPVLDDFGRSMKAGREHDDFDAFFRGVELVHAKLLRILRSRGLVSIEAAGKPFDEHFHEAILQMPHADLAPGTVIDEVETGYQLHEKVIRHSKVTVSAEPAP